MENPKIPYIVFDIIIFAFLLGDLVFLLYTQLRSNCASSSNLRWRRQSYVILASIAWFVIFYGSFIEPRIITVKKATINLGSSATLRAVLVGDFHVGPYKQADFVAEAVEKINAQKPDVIFLAGDFIFEDAKNEVQYLEPLKNLSAPLGVFAVLGNHDYGVTRGEIAHNGGTENSRIVTSALKSLGIRVLINSTVTLEPKNADGTAKTLFLRGVEDYWTNRVNIGKIPHPSIVLAHNPDTIMEPGADKIDLMLSAHTHGGQVRLPLIGSVPPIPDILGRKYDEGLFQYGAAQLFITSGIGEIGARARLFNPPEIAVLTIKY
jgi:hypothetical protein